MLGLHWHSHVWFVAISLHRQRDFVAEKGWAEIPYSKNTGNLQTKPRKSPGSFS